MARQTFFSFHYDDIWRANVVRNSGTVTAAADEVGYYDHSLWETAKTQGDAAIQRLIDAGLNGASVTVVLVGAQTAQRKWVNYEIKKSHGDGKGLLAITLHNIRATAQNYGIPGPNPLAGFWVPDVFGGRRYLSDIWPTYDWINDDGYNNVGAWIEAAAQQAGR
jgi:hypothetical protein